MDRRIKFRHLDAFSAIARAQSLKRAAEALSLTQPAISKTLKELEVILGTILMERSRAGVRLTPEGEVFLHFAEQSTSALRQGFRSLKGTGPGAGRLVVGALASVAQGLVPRAALRLVDEHPDIGLEIHDGAHRDLTARLRSGDLDLVIGRLGRPESMEGLVFRQLYAEEVVVVTAPGSPAARIRRFEDLEAFRLIYPPKDTAIRSLVARMLIAQSVPLFSKRIDTASATVGRALVLGDPNAVWIISRGVVAQDVADGTLTRLDLDTSATIGAVGIMSRAEEVPSPAARTFARALSATTEAMGLA